VSGPWRTHLSTDLVREAPGSRVALAGWAHHRRDHGGIIFLDLRDPTGIVQVVCDPARPEVFACAERVRAEYVLAVRGVLRARPAGTENPRLATGALEVLAESLEILNPAEPLPFALDEAETGESVRLRYRYLDLRRPEMQARLRLRARVASSLRRWLDAHGFLEVETPMLTRATPEGARDFLVPSRLQPGAFYALPQSPQLYKQILMMGGIDRYYQIVRCFRDEDLRADRQPEFTQLDVETSFLDPAAITGLMEEMIRTLFREVLDVALPDPFPRLGYDEVLRRFGSDKPDLRNPLEISELTDWARATSFQVFARAAARPDGRVAALRIPGGGELARARIDAHTELARRHGLGGLAWIRVLDPGRLPDGLQSPVVKFLTPEELRALLARTGARAGDLLYFAAEARTRVDPALDALRQTLGRELGLVREGWAPLWVTDFPMFAWNEDERRWEAMHHPFTAPRVAAPEDLRADPGAVRAHAYDLVLNGYEIGGGSVRIHRADVQSAVFDLLGLGREESEEKFGFLLEALRYGAPPHGGMAFGLDRLVMLMAGAANIREVIAFPKTQTGSEPLSRAPSPVDPRDLAALGLKTIPLPGAASRDPS
jgi:aspartyl-tRNA synthetase